MQNALFFVLSLMTVCNNLTQELFAGDLLKLDLLYPVTVVLGTMEPQLPIQKSGCFYPQRKTYTCLLASFPGQSLYASTRNVKPVWILMKQEMTG